MTNTNIKWLQNWFFQNCDGFWEKQERFVLNTIDNPGWIIKLFYDHSFIESNFNYFAERSEDDWIDCVLKKDKIVFAGGPFNLNEMFVFFRKKIGNDSAELSNDEIIDWIQKWYNQYCDGEWEDSNIFDLRNNDCPGWSLTINLEETPLEDIVVPKISYKGIEGDWSECEIKDGYFQGKGGIFNLLNLFLIFKNWVEKYDDQETK